ncbi:hypothetical protein [Herbidospora sp. RD11066]
MTASLYDQASRLHTLTPDGPLSEQHHEPVRPRSGGPDPVALLKTFFADPGRSVQALHDALQSCSGAAELPGILPDQARETGVWLVRRGIGSLPVETGLRLLMGRALPEDVPLVRTIGLLDRFGSLAVDVLAGIPGAAGALTWLADRSRWPVREKVVESLCRIGDPDTFPWLLRADPGKHALRIAETVSLADLLESGAAVTVEAGRILQALVSTQDYTVRLHEYADACRAVAGFAVRAETAEPELDLLASVITMAHDLRAGHAACLPWPPGERAVVLDRLERLLVSPRWAPVVAEAAGSPDQMTRWRAEWAARAGRPLPVGDGPLAVHAVAPDPASGEYVSTRVLVDGRPVVAEAFRVGGSFGPEALARVLAATEEPRETTLASAWCAEECCGALRVTIVREGDTVVWRDWLASGKAVLETFRFPAAHYDETVARADRDRSWEWPAQSVARELDRLLEEDPGLLGAWQCVSDGAFARADAYDEVTVYFWSPGRPGDLPEGEPSLQFEWVIAVDGTDDLAVVVELLREVDPRTDAEVVGGSGPG